MLGHRRLPIRQRINDLAHGPLAKCQIVENFPTAGLCDRIERIRRRRGTCHSELQYIPILEYVKKGSSPPSRAPTVPDRPREILEQVFLIFDADREPDEGISEAAAAAFLLGDGRVCHRGGMTNE